MNLAVYQAIKKLNLSYFDVVDVLKREKIVNMLVGQRQYDYPEDEEITEALDAVQREMEP